MHHPTYRIAHTTAFVTPVVEHWLEREIAQCVHSMKDRSDGPSHHERTLLPRSYISLPVLKDVNDIHISVLCNENNIVTSRKRVEEGRVGEGGLRSGQRTLNN